MINTLNITVKMMEIHQPKKYIKNITSYLGNIIRASDKWKIIYQQKLT